MIEKNHDIFKTKMRLFYVIIANNLHDKLFNRKKAYTTTSSATHCVGVFQYDNYIIRIDDSPHCFESEKEVIQKIGNSESGVVLPFFTHINIPEKKTPESTAETGAGAGAETVPLLNKQNQTDHKTPSLFTFDESSGISYSDHLKNTFKKYNISFSVQPYIKNTESLLYWVKDNITDHHNLNLTHVRKTFIIPLFYKCACLIESLHLHDIVHGDIKPDNILIEQTDKFHLTSDNCSCHFSVYLIDYGLSGKANISIGTGGTTPYCHPEFRNIRDSKDTENYRWGKIQKKHDVWSLGLAFLTLYVYGKFNSYYHKFPSYFFEKNGYIADMVIDTIADIRIRSLFRDMMTGVCISITEVKVQLHSILL
jgi:serine/threonine protein kinase